MKICHAFSDQKKHNKVLCGHTMVKSGYVWYVFNDQIDKYMMMKKLSKKN